MLPCATVQLSCVNMCSNSYMGLTCKGCSMMDSRCYQHTGSLLAQAEHSHHL